MRCLRIRLFLLLVIIGIVYAVHKYFTIVYSVGESLLQQYAYLAAICVACDHSIKVFLLVYPAPIHT